MRQQNRWVMALVLGLYCAHVPLAWAQPSSRLLEMSEQLDKIEKQDFSAALDQANACIRARSFDCSDRALAKAEKAANGSKDRAALQAARNNLASERQLLADEKRRAEDARLASIRREEEARAADERREREREEEEERRYARASERESQSDSFNMGAYIQQKAAENARILGGIDRQTNSAINESNRILAQQAAERDRLRAERQEQMEERARERRAAADQRLAQASEQRRASAAADAAQERARQQEADREQERQRAAKAQAEERAASEQRTAQLAEQRRADETRKREQAQREEAERQAALPRVGGPPNKDGCWIPDRNRQWCVVVTKAVITKSGEVRITYRNDCPWGVYVGKENERNDGSWDGGQGHLAVGKSDTWWGGDTGAYRYNFTGSAHASGDWVCSSADPGFNTKMSGRATR